MQLLAGNKVKFQPHETQNDKSSSMIELFFSKLQSIETSTEYQKILLMLILLIQKIGIETSKDKNIVKILRANNLILMEQPVFMKQHLQRMFCQTNEFFSQQYKLMKRIFNQKPSELSEKWIKRMFAVSRIQR